jgi:hypothetical protein
MNKTHAEYPHVALSTTLQNMMVKISLTSFWHHLSTNLSHQATLVPFHTVSGTNKHPQVVSDTKLAICGDFGTISAPIGHILSHQVTLVT